MLFFRLYIRWTNAGEKSQGRRAKLEALKNKAKAKIAEARGESEPEPEMAEDGGTPPAELPVC